jgi:hypothetical protein
MYPIEITPDGKTTFTASHNAEISPRDVNTLKHIYSSPALPQHFSLPAPVEWGSGSNCQDAALMRPPLQGRGHG